MAERPSSPPSTAILSGLMLIGAAHLVWTGVQWRALFRARQSGEVFCAFGSSCQLVWDSAFAGAVREWTLVPVAGWGVLWSALALALPLLARIQLARGRSARAWFGAAVLSSLGGVVAVAALALASLQLGQLCVNCLITYGMVLTYAVVCLTAWRRLRYGSLRGGLSVALALGVAAYAALLPAALRTPQPSADWALELPEVHSPSDKLLADFLQQLEPQHVRILRDSLAAYSASPVRAPRPPRALLGSAAAPVRVTEFADMLCGHCAALHETLGLLRTSLPEGTFSIESRYFPLDPQCNPVLAGESRNPVRCSAAKLMICAAGRPDAFELAGEIFRNQDRLDEQRLRELAEARLSRSELSSCLESPDTEERLREDIEWAVEHDLEGTPLVLINGRKGSAYPPFLVAMVLAAGDPAHPLLAALRSE